MTIPKTWLHIGSNIIKKSEFKPVLNREFFNKAYGGVWASPLRLQNRYLSDWHRFLVNEMLLDGKWQGVLFTLKKNARIYVIDSQEDLMRLMDEVGSVPLPIPISTIKPIDFQNACEHYDVIYLTERGQWKTRMPFENIEYNLYGWDVECCFIMNPDVIEQQQAVVIKGEREREKLELFK